jgi:hypothetical protein
VANNWSNNLIPPATITGNATIIIDPPANGECVLNVQQYINNGANFKVAEGKKFRVLGELNIHQ